MSPPHDPEVARLLAEVQAVRGEPYERGPQNGDWMSNPVLRSASTVVYLGASPSGRARIAAEFHRMQWARRLGIPVPEVLDHERDHRWLLVRRVGDDEVYGPDYVDQAVDIATRLARATEPPPEGSPRSRRGSRHDLVQRAARAVASPLRIGEFRRVRRDVDDLLPGQWAHGDFHVANVLSDGGRSVVLIDFEYVGAGPSGLDLTTLWPDLPDQADRDRLLEATLRLYRGQEPQVLLLLHWHALRHLADLVTPVPLGARETREVAMAAAHVAEARRLRRAG